MLIVIDLSKKLVGYNLFESFIYKFKNESNLVLANNPLTENKLDYNELRIKVQDILYNSHTNSFSLCILYDMNEQSTDPLKNSLINNIHNIEELIIKPLSLQYTFNKLYYFSLDDISKDIDGIPYNENVKIALDIDSLGYLKEDYNTIYKDILFTKNEIEKLDIIWENIKNNNDSLNQMISELNQVLDKAFSNKIDLVNNSYKEYTWYADKLNDVYKVVINNFETTLYQNANNIKDIKKISEYIKENLENKVSSYSNKDINFIHINLNKTNYLNNGISKYRHQIEILSFIIYLATNDTKFVFEEHIHSRKENHWEINIDLNEEELTRMLKSYISKLKLELENIKKIERNEVEYEEFKLDEFNLSLSSKKTKLPRWIGFGLFYQKSDVGNISNYINELYIRYVNGIKYANERLCDLTSTLRIKREASYTDKITKKIEISKLDVIIKDMNKKVVELEQKVALNQLIEINDNSFKVKQEYQNIQNDIEELINKRISFRTFIINSILIIITSLSSYKILSELVLLTNIKSLLSIIILLIPIITYSIIQYISLLSIKMKIDNKISILRKDNDNKVSIFYSDDNKMIEFVKDTYELIMIKKYIDECNLKIKIANDEYKKIEYHKEKLQSIYESTKRLIDVLGIDINKIDINGIEKINNLDINKDIYLNELYCPLNYLSKIEEIENKVIINEEQSVVNSSLISFVNKFNITYDKEYYYDRNN